MLKQTCKCIICFFIVLLTVPYCVKAQDDLITPASKTLQMKYLRPYKNSFDVIVQNNGKKKDYGLLIDEVKIIEMNGNKYFERIQKMPDIGLIDTSINNFNDLSPVFHSGHNSSGYMHLNFRRTKVTGKKYFSKNDSTFVINMSMPGPYFDSNMFDVVLQLLPLKKDFEGSIPYYEFESGGYVIYKAKVTGDKKFKTAKGKMKNVWVLETTDGKSATEFYITKETRSIVKKVSSRSPRVKILFEQVD